jgi:hypothetical protein
MSGHTTIKADEVELFLDDVSLGKRSKTGVMICMYSGGFLLKKVLLKLFRASGEK